MFPLRLESVVRAPHSLFLGVFELGVYRRSPVPLVQSEACVFSREGQHWTSPTLGGRRPDCGREPASWAVKPIRGVGPVPILPTAPALPALALGGGASRSPGGEAKSSSAAPRPLASSETQCS